MKWNCIKDEEKVKFTQKCNCGDNVICSHAISFQAEIGLWKAIIKQLKKELK